MNKDQVSGKVDRATGKVKQKVGEAVGDEDMANRGVADQVRGAGKETWGDVKDAAHKDAADDAHRTREHISHETDDAKDRAKHKIDATRAEHRVHEDTRHTG